MSEGMVFNLPELELLFSVVDEALMSLLHTILFLRARQAVTPVDEECERLRPLTYPRIGSDDVNAKVISAVKNFKASLRVGSSVKGLICVNFYVKALKTNWIFQQIEDKTVFEKWMIPVCVRQDRSGGVVSTESLEGENRSSIEFSLDQVQRCLMEIFAKANLNVEHIPDRDYSFSLEVLPYTAGYDMAGTAGSSRSKDMVTKLIDSKLPF